MDAGLARAALLALAAVLLPGCYYGHLIGGQYDLLSRREPIERLVARPDTDPVLRARLERALAARRFAVAELGLPDNRSYTTYADLGRPYAVWNVFAAPELSLEAHEWCYLMVGCLAYRGYYDHARAEAEAGELRGEGLDAFVAGIPAYSTLGWFDDPVLNTMLGADDADIAGSIFHELAHQVVFADGDTAFNESFATFVEQEGLRRYLRDAPELAQAAAARQQRESGRLALIASARARLEAVYASDAPDADKRERKRAELEQLRREAGLAVEPNNAFLLPFGLYHRWVSAFGALLGAQRGEWRLFYAEVRKLAELDAEERTRRLEGLGR